MLSNTALGVDIGGSGMKAAIVDVTKGELVTSRYRIPTPRPATPAAMAEVFQSLIEHFEWDGPMGCTFPGVIRQQRLVETAANLHDSWIGVDAAELFRQSASNPVVMINDADAAGLAEMAHGAGRGVDGVVFMLTIGTGLGTALFNNGSLVPNTELGHIEIDGIDAESRASSRAKELDDLPMDIWAQRLEQYLQRVDFLLSPDLVIIGGGISKNFDEFAPHVQVRAKLVAAEMRNHAGIAGAAMATGDTR